MSGHRRVKDVAYDDTEDLESIANFEYGAEAEGMSKNVAVLYSCLFMHLRRLNT